MTWSFTLSIEERIVSDLEKEERREMERRRKKKFICGGSKKNMSKLSCKLEK